MKVTVTLTVIGALGTIPKVFEKSAGRVESQRTNRNHMDYIIIEISQNIEKSPGDRRRFVVIQTPVKDHQLMCDLKNSQGVIIKIIIIIIIIIWNTNRSPDPG